MKRTAFLMLVVALAACGSDSTAPSGIFTGVWAGSVFTDPMDTLRFELMPRQSGSTITGIGTITLSGPNSIPGTSGLLIDGTSTSTELDIVMTINNETVAYTGTYVGTDSIVGTYSAGLAPVPLSLKRQ